MFIKKKSLYIGRRNLPEAIVIGASAGGMKALEKIVSSLPSDYPIPIIIVQHQKHDSDNFLMRNLDHKCKVNVKEVMASEPIVGNYVYLSPSGYHLLIEADKTFNLSCDEPVNYSIPSIDVLFETAAEVYEKSLVGIVLTGANSDGTKGMKAIRDNGGITVVEDPSTAYVSTMPESVLTCMKPDHVLSLDGIALFIKSIVP